LAFGRPLNHHLQAPAITENGRPPYISDQTAESVDFARLAARSDFSEVRAWQRLFRPGTRWAVFRRRHFFFWETYTFEDWGLARW